MVDPNSARKLAWDWLVVCFVVFTTLATPLDLAFFDADCRRDDPQARTRCVDNSEGAALRKATACEA